MKAVKVLINLLAIPGFSPGHCVRWFTTVWSVNIVTIGRHNKLVMIGTTDKEEVATTSDGHQWQLLTCLHDMLLITHHCAYAKEKFRTVWLRVTAIFKSCTLCAHIFRPGEPCVALKSPWYFVNSCTFGCWLIKWASYPQKRKMLNQLKSTLEIHCPWWRRWLFFPRANSVKVSHFHFNIKLHDYMV